MREKIENTALNQTIPAAGEPPNAGISSED